ncbi:MAG: class I SAM-dependent methyltransferase [Proteobacteria bacterium]|nr:class I SAM-dependent methyltransferase [Pseudomonadota bacterium]
MRIHPIFGPCAPEKGWVPTPSFLLRRDRVLRQMAGRKPGAVVDVGCGAGALLHELAEHGFSCETLETSETALEIARHVTGGWVLFHQEPQRGWLGRFDYLLAFEVLEQIEDDLSALADWHSWLGPGGLLLMPVAAKMKRWSASDVWAGHYRRYERPALVELVSATGFSVEYV